MWHDAPRREYLNLHDAERRATFPADVGPGRDRNISNSLKKDYMKLMKSNDLLATQITDLRPMPRAQFFSKTFDIPRASQKTYCFWCLNFMRDSHDPPPEHQIVHLNVTTRRMKPTKENEAVFAIIPCICSFMNGESGRN
jgi:hypothetical protein